jgi:hypothetical protein
MRILNVHTGETWEEETCRWDTVDQRGRVLPPTILLPNNIINTDELLDFCGEHSRHKKGDTYYILEMLQNQSITLQESRVLFFMAQNVYVRNYIITTPTEISHSLNIGRTHVHNTIVSLMEDSPYLSLYSNNFTHNNKRQSLYILHPKISYKGNIHSYNATLRQYKGVTEIYTEE